MKLSRFTFFLSSILLHILPAFSYAQALESKSIQAAIFLGGGRSFFATNVLKSRTRYPTPEYRLGVRMSKPLNHLFEVEARPALGIKMNSKIQNTLTPFEFLEQATRNKYLFIEVPLLLGYNVTKRIGIKSGGNARMFLQSKDEQYGFLSNKFDFGIIGGANIEISKKLNVGIEYLYGITRVYQVYYYNADLQPDTGTLTVRNRLLQIALEYRLGRLEK